MPWSYNPFTGTLDQGGGSGWSFNPFTGTLDFQATMDGWRFNPFTGTLDKLLTGVSPVVFQNFLTNQAAPSWLDNSGTTGNRMIYDSTGTLTWAPSNLATYSQAFGSWNLLNTTVLSDVVTAPDGTLTADKLVESNTNTEHLAYIQPSYLLGNYIYSIYAKPAGRNVIEIICNISSTYARFNVSTGTVMTSSGVTSTGIQSVGNGWYRCWMVFNAASSSGTHYVYMELDNASKTYQGDGSSGLYIWGAQIEPVTYQTFPRPYIPTTAAAVYGLRFDYDPATLAAKGLLIEESRTNAALYSNNFTNAAWVKSNGTDITAALDQTGVDGVANSASSLLCNVANGTVLQSITLASSARAQSAIIKRLVGTGTIWMTMDGGTTWRDITSQISSSWATAAIASQTLANPQVGFRMATAGDKIAVQYFQNENGAFSTSTIPTVAATVTRAADIVKLSGAALTAAGAANGSAVVQTTAWLNASAARYLLASSTSRALLFSNSSNTAISTTDNTTRLDATIGGSGTLTGGAVRSAIAWNASGRSIVANNGTVATDSVNLSTGTDVYLGGASTTPTFNGWIAQVAIYNQRLPDATLKSKSVVGAAL